MKSWTNQSKSDNEAADQKFVSQNNQIQRVDEHYLEDTSEDYDRETDDFTIRYEAAKRRSLERKKRIPYQRVPDYKPLFDIEKMAEKIKSQEWNQY